MSRGLPKTHNFCLTYHAAGEAFSLGFFKLFWRHPASQVADSSVLRHGHRAPLFLGDNHRLTLHTGNIQGVSPGQPAVGRNKNRNRLLFISVT